MPGLPDPVGLLDRLESLGATARTIAGAGVELYGRSARTIRVTRLASGQREVSLGCEDGLAVRTRDRGTGATGFAACSGLCRAGLERALSLAARTPRSGENPEACEPSRGVEPLVDLDPGEMPASDEVGRWLDRAWERVAAAPAVAVRWPPPTRAWVEVAATAEAWIGDGELRAQRTRVRGWARIECPPAAPAVVVARSYARLDESAWSRLLEDRWFPEISVASPARAVAPILFHPESAAALVRAMVQNRTDPGRHEDGPVGAALAVADDPLEPEAPFGGAFDDAGFPTSRTSLADGRRWTGALAGPGHFRRPSFRDPPVASPSHLVVHGRPGEPPPDFVLVSGVVIHALEPERWILEIDAAAVREGGPGPRLAGAMIRSTPAELAAKCVATVGPRRASHLGVSTPALLFADLELTRGQT